MRYLEPYILKDLERKMVFMGGPRQCGKTTFSKELIKTHFKKGLYFNYDLDEDRKNILAKIWHDHDELIVLDEIHVESAYEKLSEAPWRHSIPTRAAIDYPNAT